MGIEAVITGERVPNARRWQILYCDLVTAECPITQFIESQPARHQMKILRFLELLEIMGPSLSRPYADLLHDGIHELRITLSGNHVRFLYFYCFSDFIVLHKALWKNTDRVPESAIKETIRFRQNLLDRIERKDLEYIINANVQRLSTQKAI